MEGKSMNLKSKISRILILSAIFISILSCADNNEQPPPEIKFVSGEIVTVDKVKSLYAGELAKPWQQQIGRAHV